MCLKGQLSGGPLRAIRFDFGHFHDMSGWLVITEMRVSEFAGARSRRSCRHVKGRTSGEAALDVPPTPAQGADHRECPGVAFARNLTAGTQDAF
jgi:hypothetical protein